MALIFPSLISADLLNLEKELKALDPYSPGYHLDCMDYHFVPNLTWGPNFIQAIEEKTSHQLWIHLMVDNPLMWVENLFLYPKTIVTFHIETMKNPAELMRLIRQKQWLPSIALSPQTPIEEILPYTYQAYQILIMSVNPGKSGQQFIEETKDKIQALADYRKAHNLNFKIAMDGGISAQNIRQLTTLGVDHFAVAQAIFGQPDPVKALQKLNTLAQ